MVSFMCLDGVCARSCSQPHYSCIQGVARQCSPVSFTLHKSMQDPYGILPTTHAARAAPGRIAGYVYLFHDHLLLSAVTSYKKMYVEVYGLRLPLSFDYVVMDQQLHLEIFGENFSRTITVRHSMRFKGLTIIPYEIQNMRLDSKSRCSS